MRLLLLLITVIAVSCFAPFQETGFQPSKNNTSLGLNKKATLKRLVQPSDMFINAFFKYKQAKGDWPAEFPSLLAVKEFKQSYDDLFNNGMYELNFERMSGDSLVLNFSFSKTKYAKSRGYDNSYVLDAVRGKYIFYAANKVTVFTVKM